MNKVLSVVFSFNRGQLLANCVRSIGTFSPGTDVIIFDDQSTDSETRHVLRQLQGAGHEVVSTAVPLRAEHGSLYKNLNAALDLANGRGYRLIHLIQDDMQFVRSGDSILSDVERLFAAFPKAVQVQTQFWKRLGGSHSEVVLEPAAYRTGVGPIGLTNVERCRAAGFWFADSERATRAHAEDLGLEGYALRDPVVARVPWPMHAAYRQMRSRTLETRAPLLVKPLSPGCIQHLQSRDITKRPYMENYCLPWGWRCWRPYMHTGTHLSWIKYTLRAVYRERTLWPFIPRRVGCVYVPADDAKADWGCSED
jgi:glycosyltransferase involved in cell wall biosynthesis